MVTSPILDQWLLYAVVQMEIYRATAPSHLLSLLASAVARGLVDDRQLDALVEKIQHSESTSLGFLSFASTDHDLGITASEGTWSTTFTYPENIALSQLENVLSNYRTVKIKGITIYNGLMELMEHRIIGNKILLDVLSRVQEFDNPEVAECWPLLSQALQCQGPSLNAEDLEVCVDYFQNVIRTGDGWGGQFFNEFGMENENNPGRIVVSFLNESCSCPTQEFIDQVTQLLFQYYQAHS